MSTLEAPLRLEATEPPEIRGLGRDDVAMLVASRGTGALEHARFADLTDFLEAGDLLVVNTSATLAAELDARIGQRHVLLRLSTPAGENAWVVELRTPQRLRFSRPASGTRLELPGGAHAEIVAPYLAGERLSVARFRLPGGERVEDFLARHGRPIRYGYVPQEWPLEAYQTIFATEPGSAEMPSAGRPFTHELVTELVSRGVLFAPITLHCGVSSPERNEAPYPERYRVPAATARLVNAVRWWNGRVIAVGTTVVRALETLADRTGTVGDGEGETNLVISPERGVRVVDGLITGWHEPEASHLQMLEAIAGEKLLRNSYAAAHARGYRWHEFGDLHLILP